MTKARNSIRVFAVGVLAVCIVLVLISDTYRPVFLGGPGLAQGALIAAVAIGVVLTYQGSGVVNMANGAIAMYSAYTYALLRSSGDLFLPPLPNPLALIEGLAHRFSFSDSLSLPDLPTTISLGGRMQFWPALAITLAFCVLLGLALHFLIYRPLRDAPVLGKVVASVGVYILLQTIILRRFSAAPRSVPAMPIFGKKSVDLWVTTITREQLFVVAFVIACAISLRIVFNHTRFGLATRAAAENERGAICLGLSPSSLAGINWVLSCVVTGLLGVFVASINSNVDATTIPALIIPALTAALVGGFTSFGLTTIAAFLLGMQLPVIQVMGLREDWFPKAGMLAIPGVDTLIPLLVIVLVLFLRGDALPQRGATTIGRLPSSPEATRTSLRFGAPVAVALGIVAPLLWLAPDYRGALTNSLIGMTMCLSVVVVTGMVGQLSLAPATFAGITAFSVAYLSHDRGWPFPIPIFIGVVAAVVMGLVVAVPALRIRGVSLAIVTLSFGLACDRFIFDNENVNGGLNRALVRVPDLIKESKPVKYHWLGFLNIGDGKQPNPLTTIFCLLIAAGVAVLVVNLRRSATGRRMLAVRTNERAAAAAGVGIASTKALAFGISAGIAGVAGAVIALRSGSADQERFTYSQSLLLFAFAYLGGITRVSGALIGGLLVPGGLVLVVCERFFGVPAEFGPLLGGFGLVIAAVMNPEGIAASLRFPAFRHRKARA